MGDGVPCYGALEIVGLLLLLLLLRGKNGEKLAPKGQGLGHVVPLKLLRLKLHYKATIMSGIYMLIANI